MEEENASPVGATKEESTHEPETEESTARIEPAVTEEEYDSIIAELLTELERVRSANQELREQLAEHENIYEHARRPEPAGTTDGTSPPDERHWYFRHIRK